MFDTDEWLSIIRKLIQLTKDERLHWDSDPWDNALVSNVGPVSYRVSASDNDAQPPWTLDVIQNNDGESVVVSSIESAAGNSKSSPQALLFDLHYAAYRESLGGPKVARDVLAGLMNIDPTVPDDPNALPF